MSNRLALGTVQFGLPYGIANRVGQVDRNEVTAILACARAAGLDTLDTAIAYGNSEQRLGEADVSHWHVVSKLPPVPESCKDVAAWVRSSVSGSLQRLRIPRLYGLLLHRSQEFLGPRGDALHQSLIAMKREGLVERIGVSIYAPEELDALESRIQLDLVQAPFSVVDRRLASSGWLARLHRASTEVHVRSIFLQGLLLMDAALRPAKFSRWQSLWDGWDRWLCDCGLTPLQGCLGFALSHSEIDRIVVGVDSVSQLQGILESTQALRTAPPSNLLSEDLDLVNPSRWSAS